MKRIVKAFSLSLALLAATVVIAQDAGKEKSKSYSKSYNVSSGDKIKLNNSFGEMKITTWDRNEIKVDVSITSKANTDQRAQQILDSIRIEDGKNGSEIFFKTHINEHNNWDGDNNNNNNNRNNNRERRDTARKSRNDDHERYNNESFKINYSVSLPKGATLEATNSFGPMVIGDYSGPVNLSSRFGSLTAGKLAQPGHVSVEFGKGTIESINGGKLKVSFSRAVINKLSGDIDADFNQGSAKIVVDNNVKKLDIKNNFSQLYLDTDNSLSADFNIKSNFGSFSNTTGLAVKEQEEENQNGRRRYGPRNSHNITGKTGSGALPIKINNNFGHITLGHNISFDVNEKNEKNKEKEKNKSGKSIRV